MKDTSYFVFVGISKVHCIFFLFVSLPFFRNAVLSGEIQVSWVFHQTPAIGPLKPACPLSGSLESLAAACLSLTETRCSLSFCPSN